MNFAINIHELTWPKKLIFAAILTLSMTTLWTAVHARAVSAYGISGAVIYEGFDSESLRPFPSSCIRMSVNGFPAGSNPTTGSDFQGLSGVPHVSTFVPGVGLSSSFTCWGRSYTMNRSAYCSDAECNTANNWPHVNTSADVVAFPPSTRLDFRWYFQGPIPPRNYSVSGAMLYDGNNWLPNNCWTVTVSSSNGGGGSASTNTWGIGNIPFGNPTIDAPPSVSCADGFTYSLQSSSNPGPTGNTYTSVVCYNSGIDSSNPTGNCSGTSNRSSTDYSGSTRRQPADPNFQNLTTPPGLTIYYYYVKQVPKYTVQGLRTYNNGTSSFPTGTGSTGVHENNTGIDLNTQCNPFVFPNSGGGCASSGAYAGLVQITNSLIINYGGTKYSIVGYTGKNGGTASTLCYNHIVPGCPGPSSVDLSQLPPPNYQRAPADPTTLPGTAPYYIDVKTLYEPACANFTVYSLDDTATLKYAIQNNTGYTPYQGPPQGGGYPSRAHAGTTIGSSMSGGFSSGCGGSWIDQSTVSTSFPSSSITTHDCDAGTVAAGGGGCPKETILYMPPADTANVSLSPPATIPANANHAKLTFIRNAGTTSGASIEQGTSGWQIPQSNTRLFPSATSPTNIDGTSDYRLIYHYVDCTDPVLAGSSYCPVPIPTCRFVPATAATVNYGDTITLNWVIETATPSSQRFDPGSVTLSTSTTSRTVTVNGNTTYTVTVGNASGSNTCSRQVNLTPPSCGATPISVQTNDPVFFQGYLGNNSYSWTANGSDTPTFTTTGTSQQTIHYAAAGTFNVVVQSNGQSATCQVIVTQPPFEPYVRVYGGDVAAGSGLGSSCKSYVSSVSDPAKILGFNNGSGAGSGTQMATFALDVIDGFSSASDRPVSPAPPPTPAKGLSFANITGNPTYGGNFDTTAGAKLGCATDYPVPTTKTPISSSLASPVDVGSLGTAGSNVNYTLTGSPAAITGASQVAIGKSVAIYSTANDVVIKGPQIKYEGSDTSDPNAWFDPGDIPSFYVIVRGHNIYIDSSVQRLDGVFIALPDEVTGAGGTIYTCTNGNSLWRNTPTTAIDSLNGHCNTPLTINGAFVAKRVKFQHTFGDISNGNIAETFHYGPELWIRRPAGSSAASGTGSYDSIQSLPPVL